MSIKHLAIGCALLGLGLASAPASAATIPLGLLIAPTNAPLAFPSAVIGSSKSFNFEWSFSLPWAEMVQVSEVANFLPGELFKSGSSTLGGTLELSGGSLAIPISVPLNFEPAYNPPSSVKAFFEYALINPEKLGAGSYFLELSGTLTSIQHPEPVTGTVSVSAVPEMSTWLMMLTGFAGVAFVGYRRAGKGSAAQFAA